MIVDKKLKSVKAVQTLSRLNRTCAGKHDTFVLDFVNKKEDILEAFQPFYQETYLQQEVNADLIYQTQKELRGAGIYSDDDIEAFAKVYFSRDKQDKKAMGRMSSALLPVANRYNKKTVDERYQFRRQLRSLIKWYGYISQIIRMFDKDLHKEYVFCSYLINLLPPEPVDMVDLEGKLKLEYYKLQKTFEGAIELGEQKGVYEPAKKKGAMGLDPKEPLDEIIDKINEKFKGAFTDGDRVLLTALRDKLMGDKKLANMARTSDPQIFVESIFPKAFGDAAMESYTESQDTYTALFEDQNKYNAISSFFHYLTLYQVWSEVGTTDRNGGNYLIAIIHRGQKFKETMEAFQQKRAEFIAQEIRNFDAETLYVFLEWIRGNDHKLDRITGMAV